MTELEIAAKKTKEKFDIGADVKIMDRLFLAPRGTALRKFFKTRISA